MHRHAQRHCRTAGVRVNRDHGEPRNLTIARYRINATPIGGDRGGIVIRDHDIRSSDKAGIELSYNVSRITATGNRLVTGDRQVPIILGRPTTLGASPGEQLAFVDIHDNHVRRLHDPARMFVNGYHRVVDVSVGRFVHD